MPWPHHMNWVLTVAHISVAILAQGLGSDRHTIFRSFLGSVAIAWVGSVRPRDNIRLTSLWSRGTFRIGLFILVLWIWTCLGWISPNFWSPWVQNLITGSAVAYNRRCGEFDFNSGSAVAEHRNFHLNSNFSSCLLPLFTLCSTGNALVLCIGLQFDLPGLSFVVWNWFCPGTSHWDYNNLCAHFCSFFYWSSWALTCCKIPILTGTQRRRARRLRQQARRAWFLHRTGAVTLNPFALQHLRHILAAHHSRVLQFLKRVDQTDHGTGALAVALCPLPTYKQKECVEVCDVSGTLDEWNSSQYPAKAAACAAGRSKLETIGQNGLRNGTNGKMQMQTGDGTVPGQIPVKIAVSSQYEKQQIGIQSDKGQEEQRQRQGERSQRNFWQRDHWNHDGPITLCSVDIRTATMAIFGQCKQQFDADSHAFYNTTIDRDSCAKARSAKCAPHCLYRFCTDASGNKRSHCQTGSRCRPNGKGIFKGYDKEPAFSYQGIGKSSKDAHGGVRSTKGSIATDGRSMWQKLQKPGKGSYTNFANNRRHCRRLLPKHVQISKVQGARFSHSRPRRHLRR